MTKMQIIEIAIAVSTYFLTCDVFGNFGKLVF